jgi:phosphoribosylformylglycinamidine synthase subunit PurS
MAIAHVYIRLKPTLLDAQGKTIQSALENIGYPDVVSVRVGKLIEVALKDGAEDPARQVDEMCRKLLANPVIEDYEFEIVSDEGRGK